MPSPDCRVGVLWHDEDEASDHTAPYNKRDVSNEGVNGNPSTTVFIVDFFNRLPSTGVGDWAGCSDRVIIPSNLIQHPDGPLPYAIPESSRRDPWIPPVYHPDSTLCVCGTKREALTVDSSPISTVDPAPSPPIF